MTIQRKQRGIKIQYWKVRKETNLRGDEVLLADDGPYETKAWIIPQRSQKAETPGQQQINVKRIGLDPSLDLSTWSKIRWNGDEYDFVNPPGLRLGTRHVRHWVVDVRLRTATFVDHGDPNG